MIKCEYWKDGHCGSFITNYTKCGGDALNCPTIIDLINGE